VSDTDEHIAELLPSVLLEAQNDKHTLGHLDSPMPSLVVLFADIQVVSGNVI